MIPPDLTDVSQESPREAIANLAQIFRGEVMMRKHTKPIDDPDARWAAEVLTDQFANWASRLERAVQRMDQEQMEPLAPPEVPRGPWRLEPDGDAGFDVVMTRKNGRQTTIRLPWAGNDRYAVALRDAFNRVERDRPLEDEKASQRP